MQNGKRLIIFCLILVFSFQISAQSVLDADITGLWKGTMYNDTTKLNYRYEIAISEKKGKLFGYSHTYFILDDKEYHGVKRIKIRRDGDEIIIQDIELIANNYPVKPPKGVHVINILKFEIRNNIMVLSGNFETNRTKEYAPATGFVRVERKNDFRQSALVPHLEELGLAKNLSFVDEYKETETQTTTASVTKSDPPVAKPAVSETVKPEPVVVITKPAETAKTPPVKKESIPVKKTETPATKIQPEIIAKNEPVKKAPVTENKPKTEETAKKQPVKENVAEPVKVKQSNTAAAAVDISNRKIETIQAVYYKADSLELTLYDNGEVDGDTVSVLMNGEVIMPRIGLTTNAVRKTIYTKDLPDSIQIIMYAETLGSLPPNTGLLIVYDGSDRYEIRFSGDLKKNAAIVFRRKEN